MAALAESDGDGLPDIEKDDAYYDDEEGGDIAAGVAVALSFDEGKGRNGERGLV